MLFLLLLLPYHKDFLDFRSETTYISTVVVIYFNHRWGGGGVGGGEVKWLMSKTILLWLLSFWFTAPNPRTRIEPSYILGEALKKEEFRINHQTSYRKN